MIFHQGFEMFNDEILQSVWFLHEDIGAMP
jgi:hypothetical protein